MLTDVILACGLALSAASQLRIVGPIGPSELCLLCWLLIVPVREIGLGRAPLTPALGRLLGFWVLFTASLAMGTVAGAVIGDRHDTALMLHDAVAYPLLAAVSLFCVFGQGAAPRLARVAWLLVTLGGALLLLQLVHAAGLLTIGGLDPWYWERMRGWSQNPNQLAFFCLILACLAMHLIDASSAIMGKVIAIVCFLIAICAGRLTGSDTFTLALLAGVSMFVAVKAWAYVRVLRRPVALRPGLAWIASISVLALFTAGLALSPLIAGQTEQLALSLAKNGGSEAAAEANLRVFLWREAIGRGVDSGFLGLGPGPHLQIPDELIEARRTEAVPAHIEHPEANGTADFEAHNTYLDLFTQGGVVAALCLLWLLGSCLLIAFKMRRAGLAALLFGLATFAFTSNVVRQPVFWFAIALCLVSEEKKTASEPARIRVLAPGARLRMNTGTSR